MGRGRLLLMRIVESASVSRRVYNEASEGRAGVGSRGKANQSSDPEGHC